MRVSASEKLELIRLVEGSSLSIRRTLTEIASPAGRMFRGGGYGPPGSLPPLPLRDVSPVGPSIGLEVDLVVSGALDDRGPGLAVLHDPEKAAAIGLLDLRSADAVQGVQSRSDSPPLPGACGGPWPLSEPPLGGGPISVFRQTEQRKDEPRRSVT